MKLIKLLAVIAITVCASVGAFAQTNLAFLTSKSALRAYAVEKASAVWSSLSSSSQVGGYNSTGYGIASNHTSLDIIKVLTNNPLSITVLNPKDYVSLNAQVVNADGDLLFYGSSSSYPVSAPGGGYSMPYQWLTLEIASQIPVKFDKPVQYAEFDYVDPTSGQTSWNTGLNVYGNKVYFNSDYAGNGYFRVTFNDGTQRNYDLRTPTGAQTQGTTFVEKSAAAAINNLSTFQDPTTVNDQIWSYSNTGQNKTYEVIMTKTNLVNFSVTTSEGYVPKGYFYRPSGTSLWQHVDQSNGASSAPIQLTPGTWYVLPDWDQNLFHDNQPSYPYWYGGGEKG